VLHDRLQRSFNNLKQLAAAADEYDEKFVSQWGTQGVA